MRAWLSSSDGRTIDSKPLIGKSGFPRYLSIVVNSFSFNYDFQLEVEIIRMTASLAGEVNLQLLILLIELILYFKTMFPEREG